jgi:uncharacterized protein (DUF58 family)
MGTIEKQLLLNAGSLEFLAKQTVEGFITGLHKSPFHGFSVEFAEHRLYNSGESTRHIDWKLFARTDKLFTKKYEEETNLRCQIVIDTSSSMWFPVDKVENKIHFSVYAAASLIEMLKSQRDAVGLSLIDEKLHLHTQAKSSVAHHKMLFAALENLLGNYSPDRKKNTRFVEHIHDIAALCHKRSLIILFTDFLEDSSQLDEIFKALQHLKHNHHEVLLFHVFDQALEVDFELENRPYTLVDMETGEQIKIHSNDLKIPYQEQIKAYFEEVELRSKNNRIDFVKASINKNYQQILMNYLIKRSKMK